MRRLALAVHCAEPDAARKSRQKADKERHRKVYREQRGIGMEGSPNNACSAMQHRIQSNPTIRRCLLCHIWNIQAQLAETVEQREERLLQRLLHEKMLAAIHAIVDREAVGND